MRTFAYGIAVLLLSTRCVSAQKGDRHAAVTWATETREEIFARLFPSADHDAVTMPTCRVTTIRSSGSIDTFEYEVRIVEACDAVEPTSGELTKGAVSGEFLIASKASVTEQLARLKLSHPELTSEAAGTQINVTRIALSSKQCATVLRALQSLRVPALPSTNVGLDFPTVELSSATGVSVRRIAIGTAIDQAEKAVVAIAANLASELGYGEKQRQYDSAFWN